ncbi:MAG: FAD-dependent oxidoreductase [Paracoccaceae bacterium]|jgi:glycine/D-amino acid oxidase-like deaminating enzyme|nr:FAD-dependent oxidoreductase [Paracoccaceae bacterium]
MPLDRIVEPVAYGPLPDRDNYWRTTAEALPMPRLEDAQAADFAVLGAGFTGLSAALRLAEAGADVAVVDAHGPGWGASGRNGGFCCLGGAVLGSATIARRYGRSAAQDWANAERAAVDLVAETLETCGIAADRHSDGETLLAHASSRLPDLKERAAEIRALYGLDATLHPKEELAQVGMASPEFHGAVTVPIGFALNPLKYVVGLAEAARTAGARLYGDSPVTKIARETGAFVLKTPTGDLRARKLLIATNGYSSEDVPAWLRGRYLPTQSNILVTRPLTGDELAAQGWTSRQMCYDTRYHLHYFRLMPDNRMLFGVRGRSRSTREVWAQTRRQARADFDRIFPAWRHVETPHFWQGLLCLSPKLAPYVGPAGSEGAYAALAYHGNGVAMASLSGRLMADLALDRAPAVPRVMSAPMGRFPLGRNRRWLLWGMWHLHRLQDMARGRA